MSMKYVRLVGLLLLLMPGLRTASQAQDSAPQNATQEASQGSAVQQIRAALESIDPYLPGGEIKTEIDVFGSTSMDTMAHGWAIGFKKFHPEAKVAISAEGSETAFERMAKQPTSIAMLSRPISEADLTRLKELGLKRPVAVMVAREALGVFVNQENPLDAIDYDTLVQLFCASDDAGKPAWDGVGLTGKFAGAAVVRVGRDTESGTHSFLAQYVFRGHQLRDPDTEAATNFGVVKEVAKNPFAIAISGLRCGSHDSKLLRLKSNGTVIPGDDYSIMVGNYPLMRPLCLVLDLGQSADAVSANREFVHYALSQAGQTQSILAGFFPFDPPTLRAQEEQIGIGTDASGQGPLTGDAAPVKSTARESAEKVAR